VAVTESLFNLFTSLGLTEGAARIAANGRTPAPRPVTDFTGRLTDAFRGIGLDEATATKAAAGRQPFGPVHVEGLADAWENAVTAAKNIHGMTDYQARVYLRAKAADGEWKDLTDPEEIVAALRKYADLGKSRDTGSSKGSEVSIGAGNAHPKKPVAESLRYRRELIES
jgi:hypothetical protein